MQTRLSPAGGGFTLLEVSLSIFLCALVFAGAFTLIAVSSDILAQVTSLVQFKNDGYRAREVLSREVREATLVNVSGDYGEEVVINHADGRTSRFRFSPGTDGDVSTIKDNQLLYWRDLSRNAAPEVLARVVGRNGVRPYVARVNPQDTLESLTLPIADSSLVNNNLLVFSFRVGETNDFTYGGYGGADIQGVEISSTVLVRNGTQNQASLFDGDGS
ncbi:hypothetical protein HS125_18940 [bacterium]|nr:hypothetical protein [bacterium]